MSSPTATDDASDLVTAGVSFADRVSLSRRRGEPIETMENRVR